MQLLQQSGGAGERVTSKPKSQKGGVGKMSNRNYFAGLAQLSDIQCQSINEALQITEYLGYDVDSIRNVRRYKSLRLQLRKEETDCTSAVEYASIFLRFQYGRILESGRVEDIYAWAWALHNSGKMAYIYYWPLIQTLKDNCWHSRCELLRTKGYSQWYI